MPILSVIIPTHNRARYAIPTIHAVLAASVKIEVVVSDSSEVDAISSAFAGHPDLARIKFLRPEHDFSVVENFNFAMSQASGDYLVFIGDDDFVSENIADVAHWAKSQDIDAIKFSFPAHYYWGDFSSSTRWKAVGNSLSLTKFTGKVVRHDAKAALAQALANFGGDVGEMPRAYAGMISKKCADAIVHKYGALFGGVSPDIYSAALISIEAVRCAHIDYPIIIPGASGASTSGQSARGEHVGGLRDNPHIGAFKNLIWDARIPEFYGVQTVWSYSLLKAVEHAPSWLVKVSFARLFVKCAIFHNAYFDELKTAVKAQAHEVGWGYLLWTFITASFAEGICILAKLNKRYFNKEGFSVVLFRGEVNDTQQAMLKLQNYLTSDSVKLVLRKLF